jgi:plastocyanin
MRRVLLTFVAFVLAFAPFAVRGGAQTPHGRIRGRADLAPAAAPNLAPTSPTRRRHADARSLRPAEVGRVSESEPRGAFETVETTHAIMDQRGERFVPHVPAITTGTIVDFPNSDQIYHNVFLSKTRAFDLDVRRRPLQAGQVRQAGIVRVFCDIHCT